MKVINALFLLIIIPVFLYVFSCTDKYIIRDQGLGKLENKEFLKSIKGNKSTLTGVAYFKNNKTQEIKIDQNTENLNILFQNPSLQEIELEKWNNTSATGGMLGSIIGSGLIILVVITIMSNDECIDHSCHEGKESNTFFGVALGGVFGGVIGSLIGSQLPRNTYVIDK